MGCVEKKKKEKMRGRVYFVMFSICLLLPSGFPSQSKVLDKIVSFENIASAAKYSTSWPRISRITMFKLNQNNEHPEIKKNVVNLFFFD